MLTKRRPVHPGNLFKEEVIIPLGLTVTQAAADLGVSRKALSEFLNGHLFFTIENSPIFHLKSIQCLDTFSI